MIVDPKESCKNVKSPTYINSSNVDSIRNFGLESNMSPIYEVDESDENTKDIDSKNIWKNRASQATDKLM